jgi:hypothetical protein
MLICNHHKPEIRVQVCNACNSASGRPCDNVQLYASGEKRAKTPLEPFKVDLAKVCAKLNGMATF